MFSYEVEYTLKYDWIDRNGNEVRFTPGDELRCRARRKLSRGSHTTRYGLGAVRAWVGGYVPYVFEHANTRDFTAFRATLT